MIRWIPLLLCFSICTWGLQPIVTYNNALQTPFIKLDVGIATEIPLGFLKLNVGSNYLSFSNHGNIHQPKQKQIIQEKTAISTHAGINLYWRFRSKIHLLFGAGYKMFFHDSLTSKQLNDIESKKSISSQPIVSNYTEELLPITYYEFGIKFKAHKKVDITFKKTWQSFQNKISYKYLSVYEESSINTLNYEPISLSFNYYF